MDRAVSMHNPGHLLRCHPSLRGGSSSVCTLATLPSFQVDRPRKRYDAHAASLHPASERRPGDRAHCPGTFGGLRVFPGSNMQAKRAP